MRTLAFCGAGHITAVHAMAAVAARDVTVTHVASRTWEHAAARAETLGAVPCGYPDLPAGAGTVLVCTPPAQHVTDAMQALQAGAAVIVEKPITTTLDDADRLVEASDQAGGRIGYAENLAFAPAIVRARRRVGELGALHLLDLRVEQGRPTWGDFLTEVWGGGALFDLGAHPVAVALLLAAPAVPVSVRAQLDGAPDIAVDEHAEVTITFDTGLRAHVTVSWRAHSDAERVWDLQAASDTGVLRVELSPNLALEIDGEPVPLPAPRGDLPSPKLEQMGYAPQLESLLDDFDAGRTPEMGARFGRQVLDLICAAYSSAGHDGRDEPLPFTGPRDRTPLQLWTD